VFNCSTMSPRPVGSSAIAVAPVTSCMTTALGRYTDC
jgi:hypothetical protein